MSVIVTALADLIAWVALKCADAKQKATECRDKAMKKMAETRMTRIMVNIVLFPSFYALSNAEMIAANEFLAANAANAARKVEDITDMVINNPTELEYENVKDYNAKLESAKADSELAAKLANIYSLNYSLDRTDHEEADRLAILVYDNADTAEEAFIKADAVYIACKALA